MHSLYASTDGGLGDSDAHSFEAEVYGWASEARRPRNLEHAAFCPRRPGYTKLVQSASKRACPNS